MGKNGLSLLTVFAGLVLSLSALAATDHGDKERKEDVARHRAMASAHESAAKCLESGKAESVCEKALQSACKGLAIGKNCGMKHEH
ncbi:MAG: hypothetical protein ABIO88_01435 [Burkholderiaceae bacterium]